MVRPAFPLAAAAALALAAGIPAGAAPSKVWVSKAGADSDTCGAASSPCATFQQAVNNVPAGGEVGVLTPGDYGGIDIEKSVNVTNDGSGEASILGFDDVFIHAGRGDVVSLRGLMVDGQGVGTFGIEVSQAAATHIQNCVIRNFNGTQGSAGIFFVPSANEQLFVSDTVISTSGLSFGQFGGGAILIQTFFANAADVVLDRVVLENNWEGVVIDGRTNPAAGPGSHVIVRNSVISGNTASGIHAFTQAGAAAAFAFVESSAIVSNGGSGILADGPGATLLLHASAVVRNASGITTVNGGQLISYGTSQINNNVGPDGTPTGFDTLN